MNPKQFLLVGGIVLVLVGILGFVGVIGPTAEQSIFGPGWWFDNAENWAHLVLGVVALIAAFAIPSKTQKPLVLLLGIVGVLVGIYGVFNQNFLGANLENPADTLLHIVVGVWALWAAMNKKAMMA
ncbi:MAG: hypothetical protein HY435_02320 [Candidatus Liptonbacteria bacterium]|nr:hypothetical protein [Candidatus Liptonbacteria bacterium]